MRLLILASALPCPPDDGRRIRWHSLYGPLAQRHEVWWVCNANHDRGDVIASARMFHQLRRVAAARARVPRAVLLRRWSSRLARVARACSGDYYREYRSKEMMAELAGLLPGGFDAVVVETEDMASYVRMAKPGVPWVLSAQNVPSVVARRVWQTTEGTNARLDAWFSYQSALRLERNLFPRFDAVVTVSELEREMLVRRFRGTRFYTVHNGVHSGLLQRQVSPAIDGHLLNFTGSFHYAPNRDAMRHFCASVLPLILQRDGKARLELIGKDSDAFAASLPSALPVTGLGYVDDVPSHIARASAVVAPLRVGGGTRIKILEAIALGKPVVATSVGAEGLGLDASCGLLRVDDDEDFADAAISALRDPSIRERASTSGRARVARDYTWEAAARRLEDVLRKVVGRPGGHERTR